MLFSSNVFLFAFLPAVLLAYYLAPRSLRNPVLLLFSLFFYGWGEPVYLFLMIGDILFLWVASIPLGYLAGLVFHWPAFWIYTFLKIDQIIKSIWCIFRLRSGKWLKRIDPAKGRA